MARSTSSRNPSSENRVSSILTMLTLLVILIALYLPACTGHDLALPADRELVTLFRAHRKSFERLRSMAIEDTGSVSYLSTDTLDHNFLSAARRKEYADLLSTIRSDLVMRIDPREISFSYSGGGAGLSIGPSWIKGISYLPSGPKDWGIIVKNLDTLPGRDGQFYVPIDGNWYIVYKQLE